MRPLELLALGTPVMDGFAQVEASFLQAHKLAPGSSNFMNGTQLTVLERALGPHVRSWEPGDNARNVCESYARLQRLEHKSEERIGVAYTGTLGSDTTGNRLLDNLRAMHIQPYVQYVNGASGRILALVTPDGQRTFAVALGVSEQYAAPAQLPAARWFYLTSITLLTSAPISRAGRAMIESMRKQGARIAIALESPAMLESKREEALLAARRADALFLNLSEMEALGLDEAHLGALAPLVFLKRGAEGSSVFERGIRTEVPTRAVPLVVDTTGAGDNYAAGVLWALNQGMDAVQAAKVGSQLGRAVVGKFGASLPLDFRLEK